MNGKNIADQIATAAIQDVVDTGLENATSEQRSLLLQAEMYRSLKSSSKASTRNIVIPIKTGVGIGMGLGAGIASAVIAWVKSLGGA